MQRWTVNALVGIAVAAIFLPLVLTVYLSVFDETLIVFPPKGYTLAWYPRILPEFGGDIADQHADGAGRDGAEPADRRPGRDRPVAAPVPPAARRSPPCCWRR